MDTLLDICENKQELACIIEILLSGDSESALADFLSCLGKHLAGHRAFIFEEVREGRICNTYEWCAPGIVSDKEHYQYATWGLIEQWLPEFKAKNSVIIEDVEQAHLLSPEYNWLRVRGIKSIFICPLIHKDNIIGFFGVSNGAADGIRDISAILPLMSQAVVTIILRRDQIQKLQYMSYHDQLTGVYNRYAMEELMAAENTGEALGLVYCDISGLKYVNDVRGHIHGDGVILSVSQLLTEQFPSGQVYRIGGDEFLVMCFGVDAAVFYAAAEQLHEKVSGVGTHVAMGAAWSQSGSTSINQMVLQAEEQMYKDKQSYYVRLKKKGEHVCCRSEFPEHEETDNGEESTFQTFIHHNYFDAEALFKSVAIPEAPYYLYFGDLQRNLYYISDNMRDDFGFQSNVVPDLIEKWGMHIHDPQERALYQEDLRQMLEQKKDMHSLRYRVTDKNGYSTWVHCRGITKWSKDRNLPLFFSGCVSRIESDLSLDAVTGFLRERGALNELTVMKAKGNRAIIIGFALNNFTYINESRGRLAGDNILRNIANTLLDELGNIYTFYRLDGIRFMAVSRPENTYSATESVRRIRAVIDAQYSKQRVTTKQAAAFGVLYFPGDGQLPQEILENAISMINVAKLNPDMEFCEYSPDVISKQKDRSNMALRLSECVEHSCENFRMVIQPIVDCDRRAVIGGEVLLRWKYEGKDISPAIFIPLLEETRMILTVGKWVFEQAVKICREVVKYQPDFLLSFNVSYLQVQDDSFLPFMQKTLEASGLPGCHLMVELTETHFDEMPERLHNFVGECLAMGMKFALDDFGNAFSSLQMLLKYPVNVIKLDRTLMNEITHSSENLDFIMSIVYACHRSGKKVCVEGVENEDELSAVRQTDCDMIQGFYFYRPMEIEALYHILKNL